MIRLLLASCIVSTSLSNVVSTLSFGFSGGTASLHVTAGDQFVVEAKTNPSTGYNWNLVDSLPSCVELMSTEYVSSVQQDSHVVGAPSILRLTFMSLSPCSGTIQYVYNRPWEEPKDQDSTLTINLSVYPADDL